MAKFLSIRRWQAVQASSSLRLFKNTGLLLGANGLNRFANLVTTVLIGRQLGVANLGDYSLGMAWAAVIFQIADLGLSIIFRRDAARNRDRTRELYATLMPLYALTMLVGLIISILISYFLGNSLNVRFMMVGIAISIAIDKLALFEMSIFEAHESMEYPAIALGVRGVVVLLFVPVYLLLGGNMAGLLLILIVSAALELAVARFQLVRFFFRPEWRPNIYTWKAILVEAYPLAFASIFVIVYYRIDTIMLQFMVDKEAVGYYNAAYALLGGFALMGTALNRSIFAQLANLYKNLNASYQIFQRSIQWTALAGGLLAAALSVLSTPIIHLLYGDSFIGASDHTLRVLAWTVPFMFMSSLCGTLLNASGHQNFGMYVTAVIAGLNVVLNFFFIPRLSYIGASITTVISYAVGFAIMYIYIRARIFQNVTGRLA